jgi:hypothetical protein
VPFEPLGLRDDDVLEPVLQAANQGPGMRQAGRDDLRSEKRIQGSILAAMTTCESVLNRTIPDQ